MGTQWGGGERGGGPPWRGRRACPPRARSEANRAASSATRTTSQPPLSSFAAVGGQARNDLVSGRSAVRIRSPAPTTSDVRKRDLADLGAPSARCAQRLSSFRRGEGGNPDYLSQSSDDAGVRSHRAKQ